MSGVSEPRVREALNTVLDPCSVFNGTRLSIVELGMVDEVRVDAQGDVFIRLFLDDPTCIFFFEISRLLKEAVQAIDGVGEIDIEIKADEVWSEERMAPRARERLTRLREGRRRAHERHGLAGGWPLPMVDQGAGEPTPTADVTGGG